MASELQVKKYLAYWFQLGRKVLIRNGDRAIRPETVLNGHLYSQEFEDCFRLILSPESGECFLEGTHETIAQLLTPQWEVAGCSRCSMPIPQRQSGMPSINCPCFELPNWPSTEIPTPRSPVDTQSRLTDIRDRLLKVSGM